MASAWQIVLDVVRGAGAYHGEPSPGQTTGGTHSTGSMHYVAWHGGHALDSGQSDSDPNAVFDVLEPLARSGAIRELFYRDRQYKQGRRISSSTISRTHQSHCHCGVEAGREAEVAALLRHFHPGERTIREGSRGPDVGAWQRHLRIAADGVFGPATKGASIEYQRRKGLTADGVVGPQTWAAYRADLAGPAPAPPPPPPPPPMAGRIAKGAKGIDVSHHQKPIDWRAVRGAGYTFAIVRSSYGAGATDLDRHYKIHRDGARAAGLVVGHYHYAYPNPGREDAIAEADHFVRTVGPLPPGEIVVLDLEDGSGSDLSGWAMQFLGQIEKAFGRRPFVYGYPAFLRDNASHQALGEYPLWIAHYTTGSPTVPRPWTSAVLWQQTSSGFVPGVEGNCDVNVALANVPAECFGGAVPIPPGPAPAPPPPPPPPPPKPWQDDVHARLPVLRVGANGQHVRNLQGLLLATGRPLTVDGGFGPGTERVLRAWQAAAGATADGVAGRQTWSVLLGSMSTLRVGANGQHVRNLQGLLLAAGRSIGVDGAFGPGTERVLREWQAAARIGADGVCGQQTWRTLVGV